jgi:hypothetical protein
MGASVFADSALKKIDAYQNSALHVTVNGKEMDMASADGPIYPLVYEGHSYVPAKALAEALGASINWNPQTQTVEVTQSVYEDKNAGDPTKDVSIPIKPKPRDDSNKTEPKDKNEKSQGSGEGKGGSPVRITNELALGFNKEEQGAKIKAHALLVLRVYAKALTTGDTSNLDKILDGLIIEKSADNGLSGRDFTKKLIHDQLKAVIETGNQTSLADNVLKLSDSTLKSLDVTKSDTAVVFAYKMQSSDSSSGLTVTFTFKKVNEKYLLDNISIL